MVIIKSKYTFTKEYSMNKLFSASLGLLLISNSFSAIITYNDRSTWENFLVDETTIDFEGQINSGYQIYAGNSQNVQFSSNGPLIVVDGTYLDAGRALTLGTGDVLFGYHSFGGITSSNFSANAVALDLKGYIEPVTTFYLTTSNGEVVSTTIDNSQSGFIGIISDDLISSVHLTTSSIASEYFIIDNFSFGTVPSVPEPGIFSLMVCALPGIFFKMRKKIK
jgi:hypothetical protein